jgi:anti-sigma B factor antagonist
LIGARRSWFDCSGPKPQASSAKANDRGPWRKGKGAENGRVIITAPRLAAKGDYQPMNLPTEIFGEVIVVHTPEELGADQAEEFEGYVPTLERSKVVLDLDNTEMLDSVGLSALLNVHDKLREQGGELKVTTTNFSNRKILEITRLDQQLEVFASVIDAVKSFH